jgi:hypothetical protein
MLRILRLVLVKRSAEQRHPQIHRPHHAPDSCGIQRGRDQAHARQELDLRNGSEADVAVRLPSRTAHRSAYLCNLLMAFAGEKIFPEPNVIRSERRSVRV